MFQKIKDEKLHPTYASDISEEAKDLINKLL
jgi:hypothetical protein